MFGWCKPLAIILDVLRSARIDEVRENVGEAKFGGPDGALQRRPEEVRLGRREWRKSAGDLRERASRSARVREVAEQFGKLVGEVIRRSLTTISLQGECDAGACSRSAA